MNNATANIKVSEVLDKARELFESLSEEHQYVGIRFEHKTRSIGEECECSRHNPGRDDVREFPEFGSDDYLDLPEFDGVSCYDLSRDYVYGQIKAPAYMGDPDAVKFFGRNHAYLIVGDRISNQEDADDGEIVIVEGKVAIVLY